MGQTCRRKASPTPPPPHFVQGEIYYLWLSLERYDSEPPHFFGLFEVVFLSLLTVFPSKKKLLVMHRVSIF